MKTYKMSYRQRVYGRPIFKRHKIQVIGHDKPPPKFPDGIALQEKHKEEDVWITITKIVEPYKGQDEK